MAWKSREQKLPPPSFFALLTAHLQRTYPSARISRELMMELRPYFVEAWRSGKSAEAAAQTTCSCDGREIVPSPAIGVRIAKGSVRPPRGALRGEVFGAEDLREPAPVERLQKRLSRVTREQAQTQTIETKWGQRARTARKEATRSEAERKQAGAKSRHAELLTEAQRIEGEIRRLRNELSRTPPREAVGSLPPVVSVPPPLALPPQVAPPPSKEEPKPKKRPGRKKEAAPTPSTNPPPAGDENAAMLSAIQGLLPSLASQLATQMAKDEGSSK